MYGLLNNTLVTTLKMYNEVREIELAILARKQESWYLRTLKYLAFALCAFCLLALLIFFTLLEVFVIMVLYRAVLLWRGYKMYGLFININVSFLDRVTIFLELINALFIYSTAHWPPVAVPTGDTHVHGNQLLTINKL